MRHTARAWAAFLAVLAIGCGADADPAESGGSAATSETGADTTTPQTSGTSTSESVGGQDSTGSGTTGEIDATSSDSSSGEQADTSGSSDSGERSDCGNGVLDPGEICDDGNDVPDDGCASDCTAPSGTLLWAIDYDVELLNNHDDWYTRVAVDAEGSVYVAGAQWDPTLPPLAATRGWLGKFSSEGELSWELHHGQDVRFGPLAIDPDGNVIVGGDHGTFQGGDGYAWLGKYTPDGELLWSQEQMWPYDSPLGIDVDASGNILVCGVTQTTASVRVLDGDGVEQWSVPLSTNSEPWYNNGMDCGFTEDGDVLVTSVSITATTVVQRLNASGFEDWSQTLGWRRAEAIAVAPDGTFALAGEGYDIALAGFGATGSMQWDLLYPSEAPFEAAHDIVRHDDGSFTAVGGYGPADEEQGFIAHVSASGEELWTEFFDDPDGLPDVFVSVADDPSSGAFYVVDHERSGSAAARLWIRKYVQ